MVVEAQNFRKTARLVGFVKAFVGFFKAYREGIFWLKERCDKARVDTARKEGAYRHVCNFVGSYRFLETDGDLLHVAF